MLREPEFIRRRVREILAASLESVTSPIDPAEYGRCAWQRLPTGQKEPLLEAASEFIAEVFANETRELTRGRPAPESDQVEAFPLDLWIGAAEQGKRVRYRHATWDDHKAHRENQIQNVRRVTRAFDAEEQRRDKLRDAGMADDPTMTTEEALRRIGGDDFDRRTA